MFQNPRTGRQARNFNKCSENSRSQIVFRTDIFRKLSLGAPDYYMTLRSECRGRILREEKVNSLLSSLLLHLKFTGAKDWNELPNELRADGLTLVSLKERHYLARTRQNNA